MTLRRRKLVIFGFALLLLCSIVYLFRFQIATSIATKKLLGFGWSVESVNLERLSPTDIVVRELVLRRKDEDVEIEARINNGIFHFDYPDTLSGTFSGAAIIQNKQFGKLEIDSIELRVEKPLSLTYDVTQGRVKTLDGNVTAALAGVRVGEQEIAVDPVAIIVRQTDGDALRVRARTQKLQAGVSFSNVEINGQIALPVEGGTFKGVINEARASALGGKLIGRNIVVAVGKLPITFSLEMKKISLAEIAALYKQERLTLEGQIDGVLPVTIAKDGVSVVNGSVNALPPGGTIRFASSETGTASNEQLELVKKALTNYRYTKLSAKVDYGSDGDLRLQVASSGSNPDLPHGSPIELNINLEENIPALLRSIRLASGRF